MPTSDNLTVPSLHLNGSGWDNLYTDYTEALAAVRMAIEKLPRPHGRDYYVQEAGAFERARRQFDGQIAHLSAVRDELMEILMQVSEQRRK